MFKSFIILIFFTFSIKAQTVSGILKGHANQEIKLIGFNYYSNYTLATNTIDNQGHFSLSYPKDYKGMGILETSDKSYKILVLNEKEIIIKGNHLKQADSIVFVKSKANINLTNYAQMQLAYNKAQSAWRYLEKLYNKVPILKNQYTIKEAINTEQKRLLKEGEMFVNGLDKKSYLRWYIRYRKLIYDMPYIVRNETERIPEAIEVFRSTDFTNPNFKTSGLFKELIEGHYLLLENMGQSLDSVYKQMNSSTKYLIENLKGNKPLLNIVSNKLFNYFEKRSLFKASEYLSLYLLKNVQSKLEDTLVKKLERYRKMKVGNVASDIVLYNGKKISDIKTPKIIVFGASWCPTCKDEALELLKYYNAWKTKNITVLYISLDTDKNVFENAFKNAPWETFCDFKGWESQAVKDYCVSATPSYFLLDENNKILTNLKSLAQANAWIEENF